MMILLVFLKKGSFLILFLTAMYVPVHGQGMVRVAAEQAEIYVEPGLAETMTITAQKGELFSLDYIAKGWAGIRMFSGEVRYIRLDDVETGPYLPAEPYDASIKAELCNQVQQAEDQSTEKAALLAVEDREAAATFKNLLVDVAILQLFREYSVPAVRHSIFVDCINDSVVPYLEQR